METESISRAFVYEIGTEELPARFLLPAIEQLQSLLTEALNEARIEHSGVQCFATPRRLVAFVKNMAARQRPATFKIKGPPAKIAYDANGKPTKAAMGFARSQGVAVESLTVEETERGAFVFAIKHDEGRATVDVLTELLPQVTTRLTFPKMMRWGALNFRFGRPIRWLLALWGDSVIRFELASVASDRISRGHRVLCKEPVVVRDAESYFDVLRKAYVIVNHNMRCELLRQQVEYEASLLGGKALITDELIEEVNFLIEHPTAVSGSFDVNYLNLPRDVLITTMMHHQRYFPVTDANGSLLPHFIGVRDGGTKGLDIVRQGYEKVLRARLADAQFFFNEDLKKPLEAYVEKLSGLLFQRDLGSMLDKTQRLVALTKRYCERANVDEATRNLALRTAWLCKADLVTSMVEEFTELQGVMGREYALRSGEDRRVAQAIYEHYLPRHANDELPSTLVGALVGIADRMDTLCACFDRSMIPTGSADPLGLRRAAHSIVVVLNELQLHFPLSSLIDDSLAVLSEVQLLTRPVDETKADVLDFLRMRIEALLDEWDIAYDIRDAVISVGFDDVPDVITRARALTNLKQRDATAFAEAVIAFTRVINILSKQRTDAPVNPELFVEDGERRLYDEFQQVIARISLPLRGRDESAYEDAFMKLATLKGAIDDFFGTAPGTGVLVMHPDERLRNNRLALVQTLEGVLKQIADFSKLIV